MRPQAATLSLLPLSLLLLSLAVNPALAVWPHDPAAGVQVSTATNGQYTYGRTEAVSDGRGGVICFWDDFLASADHIRAQRIDADGNRLWGPTGVQVMTGTRIRLIQMAAVADGAGGAYVAWADPRTDTLDVYVQRLDANGNRSWTSNGVAVCTAAGDQSEVRIALEPSGGVWICWRDARTSAAATDIYARRVNASGTPLGAANGIAVCTAAGTQSGPRLSALLGYNGCIVTWSDARNDAGDIYAQRLDTANNAAWTANGVVVCNATGAQSAPEIASDGGTGVVIAWTDARSGSDVYAQRANISGSMLWTANGVLASTAALSQGGPVLTHDGSGAVVVAYTDNHSGSTDLYAQRIALENGALLWGSEGVAVCAEYGVQDTPSILPDSTGGTYVSWSDARQNAFGDIYAQRLASSGLARWTTNGVPVGRSPDYEYGHTLAAGSALGCVIQYDQVGETGNEKVRVQKVDRWGYLGAEPVLSAVTDVPGDQGGQVKVAWTASPLDIDPLFGNVSQYGVYRSVPTAAAGAALAAGRAVLGDEPGAAPTGARRLLRTVSPDGVTAFWEEVATRTAAHLDSYSAVCATTSDSIAGGNPLTGFMVQARTAAGEWWNSGSLSGYSVDDLAPATPAPFAGSYASGATMLAWGANTEADLAGYRLYRGPAGFVPGPGDLVAALSGTTFTDAAGGPYVYVLTAVDTHGNESAPATLVPDGALAVEAAPAVDFLGSPTPQPLRAGADARLAFGLAREGHATLALFDVQGRRVATLVDARLPAGAHAARLMDDTRARALEPGLYLVRYTTSTFAATRRLVVIR